MLLRVADEFGFKIRTLQHVLEGYKVAKEIKEHGAGASTFSDWWSYKVEAYDAIPYNAALMHKKGVLVSLNSDDAEMMRHLNQEAAKSVRYGGLTDDEALALITINPAKQLAIDSRVGSIEVGKDADLVIYDKHPLSNYAKVQKVFIEGEMYFERDKDMSDRAVREARRKQLMEKQKAAATPARPAGGRRPQ
jgi:imidazolonepropionase-like amidohydrolase